MPQHPPARRRRCRRRRCARRLPADETVRMRADGPRRPTAARPQPRGRRGRRHPPGDRATGCSARPTPVRAGRRPRPGRAAPPRTTGAPQAFDRGRRLRHRRGRPATRATTRPPRRRRPAPSDDGDGDGRHLPAVPPPGRRAARRRRPRPWWRRRAVLVPAGAVAVLGRRLRRRPARLLRRHPALHRRGRRRHRRPLPRRRRRARSRRSWRRASQADHTVVADDVEAALSPATAGITLDVDGTVDAADDQPLNPWTRLVTLFSDREVDPVITGDETALDRPDRDASPRRSTAPRSTRRSPSTGTTPEPWSSPPTAGRWTARAPPTPSPPRSPPAATRRPRSSCRCEVARSHVDAAEAQRVLDETVTPGAVGAGRRSTGADGGTSAEVPVAAIAAVAHLHAPGRRRRSPSASTRPRCRRPSATSSKVFGSRRQGRPLRGVRRRGQRRPVGRRHRRSTRRTWPSSCCRC